MYGSHQTMSLKVLSGQTKHTYIEVVSVEKKKKAIYFQHTDKDLFNSH